MFATADEPEEELPDEPEVEEPVVLPDPPEAEVPPDEEPPLMVLPLEDDPLPEVRVLRQLSNSSSKERWRSRLKASQSSSNWRFWRSRHEW